MNQISEETGISKGKVHYLINDWQDKIGRSDVEELRGFVVLVKKSGINIGQCAQGYRIIQLMKNLGIEDDNNQEFSKGSEIGKNKDFSYFVEEIYHNCKKLDIPPEIIPAWIKDLYECHSYFNGKISYSFTEDGEKREINNNNHKEQKSNSKNLFSDQSETSMESDSSLYNNLDSNLYDNNILNLSKLDNESITKHDIQIPFISQISYYIDQKKKEVIKFEKLEKELSTTVNRLQIQKNQLADNIYKAIQKEEFIMRYFKWFYNLKKELLNEYNINIEDFKIFAKIINDFKNYNFDVSKLINECIGAVSLKDKIKTIKEECKSLEEQKTKFENWIMHLESQIGFHKRTLDVFTQLESMKFGLKELIRLRDTILEITEANNISYYDASAKFFKDIEEQYDNKLGFESKVTEKRTELDLLNNQVFNCQTTLRLNPYIGPTMFSLFQKGISEQDIIGINQLAEVCSNDPILINSDSNRENSNDKKVGNRSEYWRLLTDKMKKYKDIESAIKDQVQEKEKIQKEVNDLNKQQKEILNFCQVAISLINTLNVKMSYFKGFTDHFIKDRVNRINEFSRYLSSNIFLIYINNSKKNNEEEKEEEK
jgi:phage shock protein A